MSVTGFFEIVGWIGSFLYLLAYLLLALKRIGPGCRYLSLNGAGAICLLLVSLTKHSYQAVALHLLWGGVSICALARYRLRTVRTDSAWLRIPALGMFGFAVCLFLAGYTQLGIAIIAWACVFVLIFSYLLFVEVKISTLEFHIWNFLAASLMVPQLLVDSNWQALVLEVVWALASLVGVGNNPLVPLRLRLRK